MRVRYEYCCSLRGSDVWSIRGTITSRLAAPVRRFPGLFGRHLKNGLRGPLPRWMAATCSQWSWLPRQGSSRLTVVFVVHAMTGVRTATTGSFCTAGRVSADAWRRLVGPVRISVIQRRSTGTCMSQRPRRPRRSVGLNGPGKRIWPLTVSSSREKFGAMWSLIAGQSQLPGQSRASTSPRQASLGRFKMIGTQRTSFGPVDPS